MVTMVLSPLLLVHLCLLFLLERLMQPARTMARVEAASLAEERRLPQRWRWRLRSQLRAL
jgi:hypothetical protein